MTFGNISAKSHENNISFINGTTIQVQQVIGSPNKDHITRIQIRETITSHLEKEKVLFTQGIKVLSLFFIDEVAKYKIYDGSIPLKGEYAKIFEEEYITALVASRDLFNSEYNNYLDNLETSKIHSGYFSIDKKGCAVNSTISDRKEYLSSDENAYDLIMKDKERLLSLSEPVRFIFSHSALREGWDNPNIFQICTLKQNNSEISKRQEIGRGLRICVNNNGERMDFNTLESDFFRINTLTVIASESYESFATALQNEMAVNLTSRPKNFHKNIFDNKVLINENNEKLKLNDSHYTKLLIHFATNEYIDVNNDNKVTNRFINDIKNNTLSIPEEFLAYQNSFTQLFQKLFVVSANINNERAENLGTLVPNKNFNMKEFQDLWKKINIKSFYEVSFNSDMLIDNVVSEINKKFLINKIQIKKTSGSQKEQISESDIRSNTSMKIDEIRHETIEVYTPSTTKYDLIGDIVKGTNLTRKTIIAILKKISSQKFDLYKFNPEEFIRKVVKIIQDQKASTIIEGITYHKTDQVYSNDIFTVSDLGGILDENIIEVKKHIYDYLKFDSVVEREFGKKLEVGEITVYAKLPAKFLIPTPMGNYNPDWAIVFNRTDLKYIYFIAETKGSDIDFHLRPLELGKIECAKKHFASISSNEVKYDVVDSFEKLMNLVS